MELLNQLTHYGIPGVMLAVFLGGMRYLMEQHRQEREQWYEQLGKFSNTIDKLSAVLHEIKGKVE